MNTIANEELPFVSILSCLLSATEAAKNEEPLKQELSAAVEDKDDTEGQDMEEFGADDDNAGEMEEPAYDPNAQLIRRPCMYTINIPYNYEC